MDGNKIPLTWRFVKTIVSIQTFVVLIIGRLFSFKKEKEVTDECKTESIVVIRLDGIGDAVLSSGFIKELRSLFPYARIDIIVRKNILNLVEKCPYVNNVYAFNTNCIYFFRFFILPIKAYIFAYKIYKNCKYDLIINPRWDTDGFYAGYLAFFLRPKRSIGYSEKVNKRKRCFNSGFDKLYTCVLEGDQRILHEIERNAEIIKYLSGKKENTSISAEVWFDGNDEMCAKKILGLYDIREQVKFSAMGVGAGHPKRIWPVENFISIAGWLIDFYNFKVIILGDSRDRMLGEEVMKKIGKNILNLCGQTTLRQTCAILKHCDLYIGNDSGILHLAAVTGIPVVGIYCHPVNGDPLNENSPKRFAPYTSKAKIIQPKYPILPCVENCKAKKAHCIKNISVNDVKIAVEELISVK